jgi:hypothetical protein
MNDVDCHVLAAQQVMDVASVFLLCLYQFLGWVRREDPDPSVTNLQSTLSPTNRSSSTEQPSRIQPSTWIDTLTDEPAPTPHMLPDYPRITFLTQDNLAQSRPPLADDTPSASNLPSLGSGATEATGDGGAQTPPEPDFGFDFDFGNQMFRDYIEDSSQEITGMDRTDSMHDIDESLQEAKALDDENDALLGDRSWMEKADKWLRDNDT